MQTAKPDQTEWKLGAYATLLVLSRCGSNHLLSSTSFSVHEGWVKLKFFWVSITDTRVIDFCKIFFLVKIPTINHKPKLIDFQYTLLPPMATMSFIQYKRNNLGRVKRIWYVSPVRAVKVQASPRICAVSPEPPLLAHTSSESRGTFRQKARSLASLNGWACAVKIYDRMLEDTNLLDAPHLMRSLTLLLPIWASFSFAALNIAMQLPGPASTGEVSGNARNLYLQNYWAISWVA